MNITKETIIGTIVAHDYRSATAFKNHGIDFCCNGNRSIEDVCNQHSISAENLIKEIADTATIASSGSIEYHSWPLDLLADYIEKKHHRYVEARSQEILPYLAKIVSVHGVRHPELAEVEQLFKESVAELAMHMKKEELILFPHIRKMVQAKNSGTALQTALETVQNPIKMMMHEHDAEGERFRKIAALTNNYTPPEDGCNTYKITFSFLKEFEDDLHLHIHLENNILFPKSIEMEEQFITA